MNKPKLIRITTVPISLKILLKGQLKFMSQFFEVVGVSSAGEDLEIVREREGIRVEALEMSRQITPIQDFISLIKMVRFLQKEKPHIVHSHTPKAGIIGMLAAKIVGVPIRIHTVAGLPLMEAKGMKRNILNFVEKLTYQCATHVFPNSKGLYDFILEEKLSSASKLKIIGKGSSNGINTEYFSPENIPMTEIIRLKKELGIQEEDFVFVFVGRLVNDKGISELVSAFSQSAFRNLKSKLLLVGPLESDLDPLLPETLEEIERNENILSVGFQSDVHPYFAISDALVFPSYREGFPNVVMQAGAMGLPAIVTNINGCNEIIEDFKNGYLIPVKNTEALKKAMLEFLQKDEKYGEMKSQARMMIQNRFEQKVFWEALKKEYKRILEGRGF
jgi:glycosyltransferase involved in cell wall biosynthesis